MAWRYGITAGVVRLPNHWRARRVGLLRIVTAIVFLSCFGWHSLHGQSNPPANSAQRNLVDGLLRTLVDSQVNLGPWSAPPTSSAVDTSALATPEFRRAVDDFSAETSQLIAGLQFETQYDVVARAMLGDAIRLKSSVDILSRRLQASSDTSALGQDIATIDGQWRNLSHSIKQLAGASSSILRRVEKLDQLNTVLTRTLQVTPQVDRAELLLNFSTLTSGLSQLSEDIELDLYTNAKRAEWSNRARDLRYRADQLRLAVSNQYAYRDIVNYYKQFYDAWMPLKRELRGVDNRYIQRQLNRLTQTNDRLHTLMWMPPVIDGQDILYIADTLNHNAQLLSDRITLRQLVGVGNSTEVFSRAREFITQSDEFRKTVTRETNLDNIRWDFRVLDTAWFDFRSSLGPGQSQNTIQQIALVDGNLSELRQGLGLESTFDRSQAEQLAATLGNLTDLLAYDMQRTVGRSNRYSPQVRDGAMNSADNLRRASRELHQAIVQDANKVALTNQFRAMDQEWQRLQGFLTQLTADDRIQIARSYQDVAPTIAKLQIVYAY